MVEEKMTRYGITYVGAEYLCMTDIRYILLYIVLYCNIIIYYVAIIYNIDLKSIFIYKNPLRPQN